MLSLIVGSKPANIFYTQVSGLTNLKGDSSSVRGIYVCRVGYDRQANQEFVLRYQRDGEWVVQKSEWTDRKVDRVRSDGHHGLITLHTL